MSVLICVVKSDPVVNFKKKEISQNCDKLIYLI